ncbi:bifunctional NAD(P)H-dependent oxidoreductase/GNAT family N-acetyltransferase [Actinoalloteichus hymeniacidonis]|uniref:bifunctional NAD(P)H-dependent oxidoreductase/GNAT family N-acetyltransferase n=1 Tax=Actinoalloteichus hymeniacidonis TaxID=340345 RepID=UPI0017D4B2AC|nr:bifunctional NAD(P)H-dependent oxidoreductase/GNAT family N-acetyltransferase [Actinoalloteichus hymeniacidonis]MBB5910952.1 NAD(P)H-dependent FMN reductase/GNAT superfamily N-acetyltransferase [Actinoalloteichus hymeniacidonis]
MVVLTCSTRPGATGPAVADWLLRTLTPHADALGVELRHVSLRDLNLPFFDEEEHPALGSYRNPHTTAWSNIVDPADGFIAITPEYNYGMPATLKNALDYLSHEWAWKPMGFVSYGNTSAGTRSVQHAKQVITTLRLVPLGSTVALRLQDTIDSGRVRQNAHLTASANGLLEELVRLAHALSPMREAAQRSAEVGPLPGSYARPLTSEDGPHVLVLQRCCWVDEALSNTTLDLAPFTETLEEVQTWLADWAATGLWLDGRLIGMVRTRRESRTGHIGRLAVVPDLHGQGIGRWLLRSATNALEGSCDRIELSTGSLSAKNIDLYTSEGFVRQTENFTGTVELIKHI